MHYQPRTIGQKMDSTGDFCDFDRQIRNDLRFAGHCVDQRWKGVRKSRYPLSVAPNRQLVFEGMFQMAQLQHLARIDLDVVDLDDAFAIGHRKVNPCAVGRAEEPIPWAGDSPLGMG